MEQFQVCPPRISAKYSFGNSDKGFFRGATVRMGWGKAVKLPSFEILYQGKHMLTDWPLLQEQWLTELHIMHTTLIRLLLYIIHH